MNEGGAAPGRTGAEGKRPATFARSARESLLILAVLAGTVFLTAVVGAGFALYEGVTVEWWIPLVVALALLPAFSIGGYMAWKARTDRSAQVTVSAQGLDIPALASRPMLWSDISRLAVSEQYYKGSRQGVSLAIFADNPASLGVRTGRMMRAFNKWYYGTPLAYNLEPLEGEPEDVLAAIRRFAPVPLLAASDLGTSEDAGEPEDADY